MLSRNGIYGYVLPAVIVREHTTKRFFQIGYVFDDAAAITPYLEDPHSGPTSQFCSALAKKLNCYVLAGYPERLSAAERAIPIPEAQKSSHSPVGANSAIIYGRGGELVSQYRKTNLYDTDMTWAKAGMYIQPKWNHQQLNNSNTRLGFLIHSTSSAYWVHEPRNLHGPESRTGEGVDS